MNPSACPINLGKTQKRARLILGVVLFSFAGFLSVLFVYLEVPAMLRAVVFLPYFISMLGFLQAKERTCVVFAYKGIQDMGGGAEAVKDAGASKFLKTKAQKIVVQAAFIAFVLTLVAAFVR